MATVIFSRLTLFAVLSIVREALPDVPYVFPVSGFTVPAATLYSSTVFSLSSPIIVIYGVVIVIFSWYFPFFTKITTFSLLSAGTDATASAIVAYTGFVCPSSACADAFAAALASTRMS